MPKLYASLFYFVRNFDLNLSLRMINLKLTPDFLNKIEIPELCRTFVCDIYM